ncbi:MAG: zinc ribbon domain-containing protein [Clostridia bacterium]|nr:zinc ribbon domain-containing protein [Clostridia bacterium]
MYCNKCGEQLPDTAKFCSQCGNSFSQKRESPKNNLILLLAIVLVVLVMVLIVLFFVCMNMNKDKNTGGNEVTYMTEMALEGNHKEENLLYGTWVDSSGKVSFTFNKDGTVRISGLSNTLGANLFTYTEIEENTIQLKADTSNVALNHISLNMNYVIYKDYLIIEIAGRTYEMTRQK